MSSRIRGFIMVVLAALLAMPAGAQFPDSIYLRMNEGTGTTTVSAVSFPGIGGVPIWNSALSDSSSWNVADPYLGAACFRPKTPGTSFLAINPWYGFPGGDLTLEFAVRPRPSPNSPGQMLMGHSSSVSGSIPYPPFVLSELFPGEAQLRIQNLFGSAACRKTLPQDRWTFVSIVVDNARGQLRFYFDGRLVDALDVLGFNGGPLSLGIGGYLWLGLDARFPGQAFTGDLDELRAWSYVRPDKFIAMLAGVEIVSYDLGIGDLVAPQPSATPGQFMSTAETITVEILNGGSAAIPAGTLLPLTLSLAGTVIAINWPVLSVALQPGGVYTHSFLTTADLSAQGRHVLTVSVDDPSDAQTSNNARTFEVQGGGPGLIHEFPFVERFGPPLVADVVLARPGWTNSIAPGQPWMVRGLLPTSLGGPIGPFRKGSFFIAAQAPAGATAPVAAELVTPVIDLTESVSPQGQFWLHNKLPPGTNPSGLPWLPSVLEVDVIQLDPPLTFTSFLPASQLPVTTTGWQRLFVDLSAFAGTAIQLRFRVALNETIVCLDEIGIGDAGTPGPGQASRPGLATLDIIDLWGDSAEASGYLPPWTGASGPFLIDHVIGPYYRDAAVTVTGAPNEPILFLRGTPNPQAAGFGSIGQLDIGGLVDPLSGLPAYLVVAADGFNPTSGDDLFCFTNAAGLAVLPTSFPTGPEGWTWGLQALVGNPNPPFVLLTNAVFGRLLYP